MSVECKVCGQSFKNDKGLHMHISKIHKITLAEYYVNFYQRKDLHNGALLPFTNKQDYFIINFLNNDNLISWSSYADPVEVKKYLLERLSYRIESKKLQYAPCHTEIALNELPSIDLYKKFFGSYSKACEELKIMPLFGRNIMKDFFKKDDFFKSLKILIDTREQQPLEFNKSMTMKLDFGDYTLGAPHYDYTYVDRKSETDFKGTFSSGLDRFKRELDRAKNFSSYVFVVVESTIENIIKNNLNSPYKSNLSYVWHNVREICHEYRGVCQFVFTGGRRQSEEIIPKILFHGKKLWDIDLQYFIDKK